MTTRRSTRKYKPSMRTHGHLLTVVKYLPQDYTPYGTVARWADPTQDYPDCSCGCRWQVELTGKLGMDWGVCLNPASHRCGLLTFEHQGCKQFEAEDRP